jgi:hypothetical protein
LADVVERAARQRKPHAAEHGQDGDEAAHGGTDGVGSQQVAEEDRQRSERDQSHQDQSGHLQPLAPIEPHAQSRARDEQEQQCRNRSHVAGEDLGPEVVAGRERGQSELTVPTGRALGRDPSSD